MDLYKYLEKHRGGSWNYVPSSSITVEHWISDPIEWSLELDKYATILEDNAGDFFKDAWGGYFLTQRGRIYGDKMLYQAKSDSGYNPKKFYVINWKPSVRLVAIAHECGAWKDVKGYSGKNFLAALSGLDET